MKIFCVKGLGLMFNNIHLSLCMFLRCSVSSFAVYSHRDAKSKTVKILKIAIKAVVILNQCMTSE